MNQNHKNNNMLYCSPAKSPPLKSIIDHPNHFPSYYSPHRQIADWNRVQRTEKYILNRVGQTRVKMNKIKNDFGRFLVYNFKASFFLTITSLPRNPSFFCKIRLSVWVKGTHFFSQNPIYMCYCWGHYVMFVHFT
jgi:hypothetical protein